MGRLREKKLGIQNSEQREAPVDETEVQTEAADPQGDSEMVVFSEALQTHSSSHLNLTHQVPAPQSFPKNDN